MNYTCVTFAALLMLPLTFVLLILFDFFKFWDEIAILTSITRKWKDHGAELDVGKNWQNNAWYERWARDRLVMMILSSCTGSNHRDLKVCYVDREASNIRTYVGNASRGFNIASQDRSNKCLSSKSGWSAIEERVMAALSE